MIHRLTSRTATVISFVISLTLISSTIRADDLDNIVFEGVVRDSAGAVLPAVKVAAIRLETAVGRYGTTNEEGRFRIAVNSPGTYILKASAPGFKEENSKEINVTAGRVVALDFTLAPSGVTEQVTVAPSSAGLVDTTRTVVGDTISRRELDELPIINRDPLQLVFLLGGVAEAPLSTAELADEGRGVFVRSAPEEAGNFSLTGAPATSNNITIDGLDDNDDRAARERVTLNPESISEVQIITNQYAAEYGRASGGRINLRTRGGTNQYSAEGYFYFGDESLNANTFFRNARGLGRVPQQQRREGVVVSGPLRKRKDFFLAGYERFDVTDFVEIRAFVPVESNPLFPLPKPDQPVNPGGEVGPFSDEVSTPETRNLVNARADFNFTQSHNASARLDAVRGENKRGFPGGSRLIDTILIEGRNSDSISFADNFIPSERIVNQARFQYSRLLPRNKAGLDSVGVVIEEPSRVTAGAFTGSDSAPAFAREEKRAQFQDNVSLLFGPHLFKAGGDVQLVRSTFTDLFASGGQFTFDNVQDFLTSRASRFVQRFNTESRLTNNVAGLFIQDEWRLRPNLTLSLGVRWDNESILKDRDNFSPRVAIAWDPFGGKLFRSFKRLAEPGKTVVRAGFGLFYNRALLRTIDDFSLGNSTLIVDSEITADVLRAVRFPEPISDQSLVERFGIKETGFLRRVSEGIEIPYTLQTGLGIERQIGKKIVATADYIFTRGAHLWRETNINAPSLPGGFSNFAEFLMSRDFDNRAVPGGRRPISGVSADVVRFDSSANTSTTAGAVRVENGIRVLRLGLNAPRSSNVAAALNAVRFLRPDPSLSQVEMLESSGSSFYHGGIFSVRYSLGRRAHFRAAYTLSKFIDEGTTNTASPQDLFDRRAERALSLQDQRHRFTFSGLFQLPFIKADLAPIVSFGSSRPFNIGTGFDRNLNDIENDRPNFLSNIGRPQWREPGSAPAVEVKSQLALAPIGTSGNLPRNYGRGPGTRAVNLRASRTFTIEERIKIRPSIDVFNLFNNSTFSFGSEFINRDDADFLLPRRTQRPRTVQLSIKLSL
ncbi:MAG TPA: TonB-dependent receptor [Blastocatellia bacterium]|nr:TonB-dependent receptor [Blastocatellia bacterium]